MRWQSTPPFGLRSRQIRPGRGGACPSLAHLHGDDPPRGQSTQGATPTTAPPTPSPVQIKGTCTPHMVGVALLVLSFVALPAPPARCSLWKGPATRPPAHTRDKAHKVTNKRCGEGKGRRGKENARVGVAPRGSPQMGKCSPLSTRGDTTRKKLSSSPGLGLAKCKDFLQPAWEKGAASVGTRPTTTPWGSWRGVWCPLAGKERERFDGVGCGIFGVLLGGGEGGGR